MEIVQPDPIIEFPCDNAVHEHSYTVNAQCQGRAVSETSNDHADGVSFVGQVSNPAGKVQLAATLATDTSREGSFPWVVTYTDDLDSSVVSEEVYTVRVTNNNVTISTSDPDTCDYNIFPRLYPAADILL